MSQQLQERQKQFAAGIFEAQQDAKAQMKLLVEEDRSLEAGMDMKIEAIVAMVRRLENIQENFDNSIDHGDEGLQHYRAECCFCYGYLAEMAAPGYVEEKQRLLEGRIDEDNL